MFVLPSRPEPRLVELPIDADLTTEARKIEKIFCSAMGVVLKDRLPVKAEYALSTRWSKKAEAIFYEGGNLLPWSPGEGVAE